MKQNTIGLIGLAVMGANLARNIASKGFDIVVYNRTTEKTEEFTEQYGNEHLSGAFSISDFVASIARPRKIIVMVQAGKPVDAIIEELLPYLDADDCIVDCGNSYYRDTIRREAYLSPKGIRFIGSGVSGGEEGALHGPSIMPGGSTEDYAKIRPIFEAIAARDFSGGACVTHIGTGASGHFVKMVHNGIEYAVMQIMAEAYDILRKIYGLSAPGIAEIFEEYSKGKLGSYLFDISLPILRKQDAFQADSYLIDHILDSAGQKGTGKWTVIDALERNIAVPSIAEAVFARNISANKKLRTELSGAFDTFHGKNLPPLNEFIVFLENGLYASILSAYAQGYDLIARASKEEGWGVNLAEISRIWEGGCIIRAEILSFLHKSFLDSGADFSHLFTISEVRNSLRESAPDWHRVVSIINEQGIAIPTIGSALSYFESMTDNELPANYLQGLRDYFGAHTYERTDREGTFHTQWSE